MAVAVVGGRSCEAGCSEAMQLQASVVLVVCCGHGSSGGGGGYGYG